MEFRDLSKKSQDRVIKALRVFNKYYSKAIRSAKRKLQDGDSDFLEELKILEIIPSRIPSFSYRAGREKKLDETAANYFHCEVSLPWIAVDQLCLSLHILNNTHIKIKDYVDRFREAIEQYPQNPPFLPDNVDDELKKKCSEFLLNLPDKISIKNMKELAILTEKFGIPHLHYNYNHNLIDKLNELELKGKI